MNRGKGRPELRNGRCRQTILLAQLVRQRRLERDIVRYQRSPLRRKTFDVLYGRDQGGSRAQIIGIYKGQVALARCLLRQKLLHGNLRLRHQVRRAAFDMEEERVGPLYRQPVAFQNAFARKHLSE